MAVIGDYLSMKVNMGGSTGEALSKARDYRKENFGKLNLITSAFQNCYLKYCQALPWRHNDVSNLTFYVIFYVF